MRFDISLRRQEIHIFQDLHQDTVFSFAWNSSLMILSDNYIYPLLMDNFVYMGVILYPKYQMSIFFMLSKIFKKIG